MAGTSMSCRRSHQQLTREWWDERSGRFDLVISELVAQTPSPSTRQAMGPSRVRHLANASLRVQIAALLGNAGYACPVTCTPEDLMEG